jgi:hypothetical protein
MRNWYRGANLVTPFGSILAIWVDCINNFLDYQKHLVAFGKHFPWFPRAAKSVIKCWEKAAGPAGENK